MRRWLQKVPPACKYFDRVQFFMSSSNWGEDDKHSVAEDVYRCIPIKYTRYTCMVVRSPPKKHGWQGWQTNALSSEYVPRVVSSSADVASALFLVAEEEGRGICCQNAQLRQSRLTIEHMLRFRFRNVRDLKNWDLAASFRLINFLSGSTPPHRLSGIDSRTVLKSECSETRRKQVRRKGFNRFFTLAFLNIAS